MKIYIDFSKQTITKVTNQTAYEGDFESVVFELLFFNYNNTNWYPTMSQLAPNGREAGDFTADEAGVETVEDEVTYLKFDFTLGNGWVSMKGISNFFVWINQFVNSKLTKKCYGKVMLKLNESTDGYFVFDPYLNPSVAAFMRELMEGVAHPAGVYTNEEIGKLTEDIGIVVNSTDGYWYYWNGEEYTQGALYQAPFYTSENKLDADYVDDTNSTNKFVTAEQRTQIGTNATNITSLQNNKANKSGNPNQDFYANESRAKVLTAHQENNYNAYFAIRYDSILYRPPLSSVYTYSYPKKTGTLALTSDVDAVQSQVTGILNGTTIDSFSDVEGAISTLETGIEASGHTIALAINTTNYQMTAILKDANGNTISTSNVIDLPLESVVVSGAYDDTTKKVILTLQDGSTIEFSVADLISGLQPKITAQNELLSDLVDDTNQTNKFVTAAEKAQITTNATAISGIKDGASIDSFADVETALGNKAAKNDATQNIVADTITAESSVLGRESIATGLTDADLLVIAKDTANDNKFKLFRLENGVTSGAITIPEATGTMALKSDIITSYNNLTDKPTIPTVNNPTITFTQGGTTKGTITLNQSSNQTIALDAGGSGSDSVYVVKSTDITNFTPAADGSMQVTLSQELEDVILEFKKLVYIDWENEFPALYDNITKVSLFTPAKIGNLDIIDAHTFSCIDGTGDITIAFFKVGNDWHFAEVTNKLLTQESFASSFDYRLDATLQINSAQTVNDQLSQITYKGVTYGVGGGATLDDIVDANGNKRFVEGTCTLNNKNGITWTYNKWSLSGTHLMIVICGIVTASSVSITTNSLGSIVLPSYIKDKINPNVNNYVTIKTMDFVDSNLAVVDTVKIRMSKFTDLALYWGEEKTLSANGCDFRIQFDLLIDAS